MIKLARKGIRTMKEEFEQDSKEVLVPVRRSEAEKEAEPEIREEPRLTEPWEIPRRWYIH